jgi:predicted nuclease with TOPRIM domain
MSEQKDLSIEEINKQLTHAKSLLARANERFKQMENKVNYIYSKLNNGYNKTQLIKDLTEITARIIKNNYKTEQDKNNDVLKQAYITGKLESMADTEQDISVLKDYVSSLKPYTSWSEL